MGFGRLIRVGSWRGDPEAAIYVMAEADPTKAIDIIKVGGTADDGDDFEDLGRVSGTLLSALSLQPLSKWVTAANSLYRSSVRGHHSEIMFGVLVIVLGRDQIAALSFSLGQRQIPLIVSLRVMSALRLWAGSTG